MVTQASMFCGAPSEIVQSAPLQRGAFCKFNVTAIDCDMEYYSRDPAAAILRAKHSQKFWMRDFNNGEMILRITFGRDARDKHR